MLILLAVQPAPLRAASDEALIRYWKQEWPRTDFARRSVPLQEIQSGGPPKDGIPAIDRPRFESVAAAARWLDAREPVIALALEGEAKAYPLSILIWHEIANDRLGETPIAVTFCPLCNASIVFERRVAGAEVDFGTTGKLRHSDLVMYDRQSETWWQQFTGSGIVGRHAGVRLRKLESQIVAFEDFRAAWPEGRVLSRVTGFERPYGRNPYPGYDDIDQSPFLLTRAPDGRLPPMERVLSVSAGGVHRVYPFSVLQASALINDSVGGEPVVVLSRQGTLSVLDQSEIKASRRIASANAFSRGLAGKTLVFEARDGRVVDRETGSQWDMLGRAVAGPLKGARLTPAVGGVHFAFAWLAFNPDTEIYGR
ncbi:MAG: DUF3179 domain-containing protein [Burkholderiales bacterium]|nr:DUF3179 domain-containing protein [Burkholderiales bacterium]